MARTSGTFSLAASSSILDDGSNTSHWDSPVGSLHRNDVGNGRDSLAGRKPDGEAMFGKFQ